MTKKLESKPDQWVDDLVSKGQLADCLLNISAAFQKLLASGLNRKAIVILIHDQSKVNKREIELVLNNLEQLKEDYTTL